MSHRPDFKELVAAIARVRHGSVRTRLSASAAAARVVDARQQADALIAAEAPQRLRADARAALDEVRQLRADVQRDQRREGLPGRLNLAEIDAQNQTSR